MAKRICEGCKELKDMPRRQSKFCNRECWSKNHKLSSDSRDKISARKTGIPLSESHRQALSRVRTKTGIRYYRKKTLDAAEIIACNRCSSSECLVVHHVDGNRNNNEADNLEIMCRSCHAKEHKLGNHLPADGGWNKKKEMIKNRLC